MTNKITFQDFIANQDFFIKEAKNNKIFVYPTDTVYGIGAIQSDENIIKIATIKKRDPKQLMSIIVPNFGYLFDKNIDKIQQFSKFNGKTKNDAIKILKEYFDTYHGVTYVFDHTIPGMRIIKTPFQDFVEKLGEPFITTSLNISGSHVINELSSIPKEIEDNVDYIIDGGTLNGRSSVLIDFVLDKTIER